VKEKALIAKPFAGPFLFFNPLKKTAGEHNPADPRLVPSSFALSASLSAEEDFELAADFLDVFVRAGERVVGFLAGCGFLAALWMVASRL
jgi:hypothetical protein